MNYNNKIKKAFTLVELIVATSIGAIVLSFIFIFLNDVATGISYSKVDTSNINNIYNFVDKLNNYRNSYNTGSIFLESSTGSDIFLMKDYNNNGVLLASVSLLNYKIDRDNLYYNNNVIGFRLLTGGEVNLIESDSGAVYDLSFQKDKIFTNMHIQNLKFKSYNSGVINEVELYLYKNFNKSLIGELLSDLPSDNKKQININF